MSTEQVVLRFADRGRRVEILPDDGEFLIEQAWGTTTAPVHELPAFGPGQPMDGVLDTNGEWWAVCQESSGLRLILADPFSLQPLYYAAVWTEHGAELLVGGQLEAMARAMANLGARVETEWAGVLPGLTSKNDFFDTMHDVSTPVARLLMTRPDEALLVDEVGFQIIPRPTLIDSSSSYEELLRRGLERATTEISDTVSHARAEHAVLNLSGGKDSRLVLAMLMAAGVGDHLTVHAVAPSPSMPAWRRKILSEDLAISSRLARRFGLGWAHDLPEKQVWPDTLAGQLFHFQQHRGGRSYQFMPHSHAYRFTHPQVRFTGAGAGALRSPWATTWKTTGLWRALDGSPDSFDQDAMAILRKTMGATQFPKAVDSRAVNRFVVTMRQISTGTIDSAVAAHYRCFRNRGHVGGLGWARAMGVINANPLLQPEFARAAEHLSPEDRDNGRMTFDLLEMLDPSLNDLPFQSGPWPWVGQRASSVDWSAYPSDPAGFEASRHAARPASPAPFPSKGRPDMSELIRTGLAQLHRALNKDGHPAGAILEPLTVTPPQDLRGQGRLVARLATWAQCQPDPGVFLPSTNPVSPRIISHLPTR